MTSFSFSTPRCALKLNAGLKYANKIFIFISSLIVIFCLGPTSCQAEMLKPRLIVEIVIDQLRADLLYHYQKRFGPEGFNYLLRHGISYEQAKHSHANTVTCTGHASISTGAYPSFHGLIANYWWDKALKQRLSCVNPASPLLPESPPALLTALSADLVNNASPQSLMASTFSDELMLAQKGRAFAIALKDRAAIPLAGHAGKAFWLNPQTQRFGSSLYYYSKLPSWFNDWNKTHHLNDTEWSLLYPAQSYFYGPSPLPLSSPSKNKMTLAPRFPHHLNHDSSSFFKAFSRSPYADEHSLSLALALLQKEKLGQEAEKTDFLGLSLSSVDAIGHYYGPNSLESEDNLLRLDKALSLLFQQIDKQVGLKNTLIILTADHGANETPFYLNAKNIPQKIISWKKVQEAALFCLKNEGPEKEGLVQAIMLPFIYLNHEAIINSHQDPILFSQALSHCLQTQLPLFRTYTLPLQTAPKDWLDRKVSRMHFSGRSGDIYLVTFPYYSFGKENKRLAIHGSPWNYDSQVPLIFSHPNFSPLRITRPVSVLDIAPTLSTLLSIRLPSSSQGKPLQEPLKPYEK